MNVSQTGLDLIKQFEDLKTNAYRCPAGIPTIGYGHTHGVSLSDSCTAEQANTWLKEDCQIAETTIETAVKQPLTQNQFDALVSFVFNLGSGNFVKSTLLKKLNAGDYTGAAEEFGKWNNVNGVPSNGLSRRRAAEKALFLS